MDFGLWFTLFLLLTYCLIIYLRIYRNMRNSNRFLLYTRKFNYQILCKLILVFFGIIVIATGGLALPNKIYWAVISLYIIINVLFLMKQKIREKSHIVDLCFVLLLLFGSPLDNYINFAFLLFHSILFLVPDKKSLQISRFL